MQYSNLATANTEEGYLYVALEGDYSKTSCHKMLKELNEECQMHGYEAVMIDLGHLSGLLSVSDIWHELTSPEAINILPFRVAWLNGGDLWDRNWQRLEIAIRDKSLNWHNFSDINLAEEWLLQNRQDALT